MPTRVEAIIAMLITLLAAAWFSPCCCQSAWVAEQAATLLTAGGDEQTCGCCKDHPAKSHDCCPLGAKGCKHSVGKMMMIKAGAEIAPTHAWIIWIPPTEIAPASATPHVPLARLASSPPPPDGTLLGLCCALTI
jgi:hypothetical protein